MRVIVVKLIMGCSGSGGLLWQRLCRGARQSGSRWVPGRGRRGWLGAGAAGLGDEAGQGVQVDGGVAEPV